jgi:hypothetical protein
LIILANTDPLVWRRIQVSEEYSFWDLHVAIQDAMGWRDYHLHEFTVADDRRGKLVNLGIPDQEVPREQPCLPGWRVPIAEYFHEGAPPALYVYDFGDDWRHTVIYEGISNAEPFARYPRCVAGARACPPEDCGGPHRFAEFVAAILDPSHPEHASLREWAGDTFDPAAFDATAVQFDDPRKRWRQAFGE